MNKNNNNINNISDDAQLTLFTTKNDSVEDLIYEFLKDRSAATERAYKRDLKHFFNFTGTNFGLPRIDGSRMVFEEVRRVHIIKYKKYLEATPSCRKKPFAPNTINRKLSAVSNFSNFFFNEKSLKKIQLSSASAPAEWL